jgi:hypothetical protein
MSRCPSRRQFWIGKTIALGIALLAIVVAAVIAETLVATGSHLIQSGSQDLSSHLKSSLRILAPSIGIWWLGGMIYTGIVAAATIGARSPALGMIAGLGIFMVDLVLGFLGLGSSGSTLSTYSISHNSFGLMADFIDRWSIPGASITLPAMEFIELPDSNVAIFRLVMLAIATLVLAYIFLKNQDLV